MKLAEKILSQLNSQEISEEIKISKIIGDLIDTSFGGSNEEQLKAVQLLKGLSISDDPMSNKFMKALDKFTSALDPKDFQ